MSDISRIVQKLWSYCHVLRDDGLSYLDYIEQLTCLLFLKMAEERAALTGEEQPIPKGCRWSDLADPQMEGERLETKYRDVLAKLASEGGMLGLIFRKAQNRIQDPAKLRRLIVELIGQEHWSAMSADVKGDAYEGLLEKNAQDTKSGAGQYFTPRPLIAAIVDCIQPAPGETICDPACGTGGFLLAAHEYIATHHQLDRDQKKHLRFEALRGIDIVDSVIRLCAMNLVLHGIGPNDDHTAPPLKTDDSLRDEPSAHFDVVLTNPPFGKKSSITVVNAEGEEDRQSLTYNRPDFWTTTSNKQLNFVQHVKSLLKIHGRAAVVVPDNVLFEGGAGEKIRRRLPMTAKSIRCSACRPASSTRRVSRRTCSSSTASPPATRRGRRSCGSTTTGPTSTARSSRTRSRAATSTTSSHVTAPAAATSASPRGPRKLPAAAGGRSATTSCSPATK